MRIHSIVYCPSRRLIQRDVLLTHIIAFMMFSYSNSNLPQEIDDTHIYFFGHILNVRYTTV